ncbi:MAG: restriction endonuclease subunit S [Tychonema bourrellyi B0820]|nr:restriction endonuclease subunit S [Tychonema bourrellyi B0820]
MSKKVNNNVPKLRFPEFEGDWNEIAISSIGEVIRGASPRPKGDTRYYGGKIPRLMVEDVSRDGKHVTPRTDFLTEEGAKLSRPCEKGTLTIVCSGTVGIPSFLAVDACIHDGFLAIKKLKKEIIYDDFLYHQLTILRNVFESSATHGGVFTNLTTEILRNFKIKSTSIAEQEKIASFLGAIDTRITQLRRKHELLQTYKRGVMQKLFSQQIRFKCDRGKPFPDWEEKKLGSFIEEYSKKSTIQDEYEVLTSSRNGLLPQRQYYDNERITERDNIGFNIILPNLVTYRSRSDDRLFFFNENKLGFTGIISNYYPVFRFKNGINKFFIEFLHYNQNYIGQYSVGTSQTVLSLNELRKINFKIPSLKEQEKIADFLTAIDKKIEAIAQQIDWTEQFKKGLLQKMFV